MLFRAAEQEEILEILKDGYTAWPKGRTFEQYCVDNRKEDAYGTRYVLVDGEAIVSSLIFLRLPAEPPARRFGIGSVLTPQKHRGMGYASILLDHCLRLPDPATDIVLLYSDIDPAFYERLGFRALPDELQKKAGSVCMAHCGERLWQDLITGPPESVPDYF